jgi:hypothetical protein
VYHGPERNDHFGLRCSGADAGAVTVTALAFLFARDHGTRHDHNLLAQSDGTTESVKNAVINYYVILSYYTTAVRLTEGTISA